MHEIEYPDDCIVDFEMNLIDLFRELEKKNLTIRDMIKREYFQVKELLYGKVPTRMDLFTHMENEIYQICVKMQRKIPSADIWIIFTNCKNCLWKKRCFIMESGGNS